MGCAAVGDHGALHNAGPHSRALPSLPDLAPRLPPLGSNDRRPALRSRVGQTVRFCLEPVLGRVRGVAAEYRNRGVGAALLAAYEARSEARHLFLCVSSFNEGARRFYERHGYVHRGTLPAYMSRRPTTNT